MSNAFLIIVSLIAASYCLFTKQVKIALGFFIFTIASVITIPNIIGGFWMDLFNAFAIILFAIGSFVIVWKKSESQKSGSTNEQE